MSVIQRVESPSLVAARQAGPAYELKFLVDEEQACGIEAWARDRLPLDPHGEPALDGGYQTTSLYFDTPSLDVYHRSPGYCRRKFRIRRYAAAAGLFLERKAKRGDRVRKRRCRLPEVDLWLLARPTADLAWTGHWFHRSLQCRRLQPACRISYLRRAFMEGDLRLTLDRQIVGIPATEWSLAPCQTGKSLLTGQVILELKFRTALPPLFRELIQHTGLCPSAVSKYRLCREAWGVPAPACEAVDA